MLATNAPNRDLPPNALTPMLEGITHLRQHNRSDQRAFDHQVCSHQLLIARLISSHDEWRNVTTRIWPFDGNQRRCHGRGSGSLLFRSFAADDDIR